MRRTRPPWRGPRENAKTSGFVPSERGALGEFFAAGLIDTSRALHLDKGLAAAMHSGVRGSYHCPISLALDLQVKPGKMEQ